MFGKTARKYYLEPLQELLWKSKVNCGKIQADEVNF